MARASRRWPTVVLSDLGRCRRDAIVRHDRPQGAVVAWKELIAKQQPGSAAKPMRQKRRSCVRAPHRWNLTNSASLAPGEIAWRGDYGDQGHPDHWGRP